MGSAKPDTLTLIFFNPETRGTGTGVSGYGYRVLEVWVLGFGGMCTGLWRYWGIWVWILGFALPLRHRII